jgi:hypothetical protein
MTRTGDRGKDQATVAVPYLITFRSRARAPHQTSEIIVSTLIINFKHDDVAQARPWPIGINDDNIVTSGLGEDDGAKWIGFAPKGKTEFLASTRALGTLDFEAQDIVPVFVTKDGGMFNWDIAIASIDAAGA